MADKLSQLVLAGLGRAAAEPAGLPLHGGKAQPGLFAATAPGRQAARRCLDDGFLQADAPDRYTLSAKGLAHLLAQASPRQLLEDLVRALESRQAQASELLAAARQMQASLDGFRAYAEKVLQQVPPPSANGSAPSWQPEALDYLTSRQAAGAAEDCPLPELYHHARHGAPALTVGQFHDGLRQLHEAGRVYLHPWTGPLYALPEPPYALLVGHEIAYYASPRAASPACAAG